MKIFVKQKQVLIDSIVISIVNVLISLEYVYVCIRIKSYHVVTLSVWS